VLVRLSHSHIRFGSFERQAYLQQAPNVQKLVDYSIEHYYPALKEGSGESEISSSKTASLFGQVVAASADLAASWMVAGFVHGVLNTDNLNITGESFDYGPYRFLPTLDPQFTAAYFDSGGLYAYGRQPEAVSWNLTRLAETLLTIEEKDPLVEALEGFDDAFNRAYCERTLARLGLRRREESGEEALADFVNAIYQFMHESQIGFDQFFFDWFAGEASAERASRSPEAEKYERESFENLRRMFAGYEPIDSAVLKHEYFERERPCTLLIDEIEAIWDAIARDDNWSPFEAKLLEIEDMRGVLAASLESGS
jgi:uncharacterized protein YdiU (UPF0061 family)